MRVLKGMLCVLLVLALAQAQNSQGQNGDSQGQDSQGGGGGQSTDGCKISVVGAGWGGAYFVYRTAVAQESRIYYAQDVCVFEQNPNRVGGRTFDYNNNLWEDLTVDLGAYRYATTQEFAKGIAEGVLNSSVLCYGGPCTETTGTRVYADQYGNNAGYATGIRGLLEKFQNKGGRVFLGYKLVNVKKNSGSNADNRPITLIFKKNNTQTVSVDTRRVLLNIHTSAINKLQTDGNILYTKSTNYSLAALKAAVDIPTYKQFVWYEDAWWVTKLNKTVGEFSSWGALPAVNDGRYYDGAVKCYKLKPNGQRQYFPQRVTGGAQGSKCYGALHVAYVSFDDDSFNYFYDNWVTAQEKAAGKVDIFIKQGDARQAYLSLIHNNIMDAVADDLAAAGIDRSSIALPTSVVTGIWNSVHSAENPAYFVNIIDVQSGLPTPDAQYSLNNLAAKPLANFEVYVASEAYGISFGWAEGSLLMVERLLAAYFDMSKPSFVSNLYYSQEVLPYLPYVKNCNSNSDCPSTNNCVKGTCNSGKCVWASKTNQACSQDDLCNLNTVCSYSGMCYGPDKVCPPATPVCVGGQCVADAAPSMPACHYSNSFGPFNLWWEFIGTTEIRFVYQMPGNSYTAFGFGSNMNNADIIASYTQGDGQRYVRDYYTFSPGQPSLDTDLGGTADLTNIFIASDGWGQPSKTWFTRKLNTGDSKDRVIVNGTNSFIYAYGEEGIAGQFQYHGPNRNSFTLDLSVCTV